MLVIILLLLSLLLESISAFSEQTRYSLSTSYVLIIYSVTREYMTMERQTTEWSSNRYIISLIQSII